MSQITELASSQINASDRLAVELVEADETPAVVIVRLPAKPTVLHPRRFPDTAAAIARLFAEAPTELAAIKKGPETMSPTETMIDCPLWCTYEHGHEYEDESQAGEPQRHH
jgi:hypothetical protein